MKVFARVDSRYRYTQWWAWTLWILSSLNLCRFVQIVRLPCVTWKSRNTKIKHSKRSAHYCTDLMEALMALRIPVFGKDMAKWKSWLRLLKMACIETRSDLSRNSTLMILRWNQLRCSKRLYRSSGARIEAYIDRCGTEAWSKRWFNSTVGPFLHMYK